MTQQPTTTGTQPVVVILGAGMGGRGVATALTGKAHLVIVDRSQDFAQAAVDPVLAAGGSGEAVVVDLTDLTVVQGFCTDLLARHGRVDAVVHLVGGWAASPTVDAQAIKQWASLAPGILGTVQTTSVAFRDALLASPHGRYFMITSTAVKNPKGDNAAYAAAKSAAEAWVRSLGASFADSDARSAIIAVLALVDQATRDANPDKKYLKSTDTVALGRAIEDLLTDPDLGNGEYIDLSGAR